MKSKEYLDGYLEELNIDYEMERKIDKILEELEL